MSAAQASSGRGQEADLAIRVVDLARQHVIADNPFLAPSAGLLTSAAASTGTALATDGETLYIDPAPLLAGFLRDQEPPTRDVAHVLAHCILLHPFAVGTLDAAAWDLAADIVAEAVATELCGARPGERGARQEALIEQLRADFGSLPSTERLYAALKDGAYANIRPTWSGLVHADDHSLWHPMPEDRPGGAGGKGGAGARAGAKTPDGLAARPVPGDQPAEEGPAHAADDLSRPSPGEGGARSPQEERSGVEEADGTSGDAPATSSGAPGQQAAHRTPRPLSPTRRSAARERWRHASKRAQLDLETVSRERAGTLGTLSAQLEVSVHRQQDYREFLRQFAVRSESIRASDDEFDPIAYTLGLDLYGDMPLIEAIEFREERRVRDFVIVIDTSSSVSGAAVQRFVDETYDVLSSEASFAERINVHIVQCDARVQSDIKLSSLADLERWRRDIRLFGFGGTDFRPAFRYVDELIACGEFDDLSGLIYFTDGWGIYPERIPPYLCAFVFFDQDHRDDLVPAWAIQLTLNPERLEAMSVYDRRRMR